MVERYRWLCCVALSMTACGTASPSGEDSSDISQVSQEQGARSDACSGAPLRRISISTGVTMAYCEQGEKHGTPVIFVHGYTDSHHAYDRNLPLLPQWHHVFSVDLRGHGESSKPDCCYTQRDFAADIVAFMDAKGLARASLVGHSMGSFVVQQVALDYPRRVDRLVLIGSAPTVAGNAGAADLMSVVQTLEDPIPEDFVRAFQASTYFRPIPDSFLDTSVVESLKVPATVWKQALAGLIAEDHGARLSNLRAPTLILYGEKDVFFSAEDQAQLTALIPRSRLTEYPSTGHGTHVEVPIRVTRDINRFLTFHD